MPLTLKYWNGLIFKVWGKLCIGPCKAVGQSQELSHQAKSLVMHALLKGGWHRGLGDSSSGTMLCQGGAARTISSWHFEVSSSEAFLLVAVPWGCSCSLPTAALSVLREQLFLCVVQSWKTLKQTSASNTSFPVVVLAMNFLHCSAFPLAHC